MVLMGSQELKLSKGAQRWNNQKMNAGKKENAAKHKAKHKVLFTRPNQIGSHPKACSRWWYW